MKLFYIYIRHNNSTIFYTTYSGDCSCKDVVDRYILSAGRIYPKATMWATTRVGGKKNNSATTI